MGQENTRFMSINRRLYMFIVLYILYNLYKDGVIIPTRSISISVELDKRITDWNLTHPFNKAGISAKCQDALTELMNGLENINGSD